MLDETRAPIRGLYAVGNDAASMMGGRYPSGGITLGPAMTFGYLAGIALAKAREDETVAEVSAMNRAKTMQ